MDNQSIKSLEKLLSYKFKKPDLLLEALTHCSAGLPHNQRLEFLGDSLLNMLIAEALYMRYASVPEGVLSHMRSTLVCGKTLAKIAQNFDLGKYVQLGPGELKSGGHRRSSILADAVEAIIAAIYLDSDFQTLKNILLRWYEERLSQISTKVEKDPKTRLQEYLQSKRLPLPEYTVLEMSDDPNASFFKVLCEVVELELLAEGTGASRRSAEQEAANVMIKKLKK